jgi:hypothetical protein
MMDDLVAWLRAQLDEDERLAQAACWDEQSDAWTARPPQASYEQYTVTDYLGDGVVIVRPENADDDGVGKHVAEWDPARVLREIDDKRQLIADLVAERHLVNDGDDWYTCAAATEERDGGETCDDDRRGKACDCGRDARVGRRLRLLARPYALRPRYDEE